MFSIKLVKCVFFTSKTDTKFPATVFVHTETLEMLVYVPLPFQ